MSDIRTLSKYILLVQIIVFFIGWKQCIADIRELYSVKGVNVDERAADELTAKTRGIEKAQRYALKQLFKKLSLREDFRKLPVIDSNIVRRAIRDFTVIEEKFGGGRYLANLTVRFKRRVVRQEFWKNSVPIAETVSQPVVVLPVYRTAGSILLWDEPNPWFTAWAGHSSPNVLLPLPLPLGDYSDVVVISAEQAINGSEKHLAAIAQKLSLIHISEPTRPY